MAPKTPTQVTDDNPAPKLLSIDQSATMLGVSTWTVRRLLKAGALPTVRIGSRTLVKASDLNSFIDRRTTTAVDHPIAPGLAAEGEIH